MPFQHCLLARDSCLRIVCLVLFFWDVKLVQGATRFQLGLSGMARSGDKLGAMALGTQHHKQRNSQPGDVSGVGDIANILHKAGAGKAAKVSQEFGDTLYDDLTYVAKSAEAAIVDPVGAIGGAVDAAAETLEAESLIPTAAPAASAMDDQVPESAENMADYKLIPATAPPAPFNGVYCRGGACQYRVTPAPTLIPIVDPSLIPPSEPCRGLVCPPPPMDPAKLAFLQSCEHIFSKARHGLEGDDDTRTIGNVRSTFEGVCEAMIPLEAAACMDYGDAFVSALSPDVRETTVGDAGHACKRVFDFIVDMQNSAIGLGLTPTVKEDAASSSLLSVERKNNNSKSVVDASVVGPCSVRGTRWRQWWAQRHPRGISLLGIRSRGRGQYDPNPPCPYGVTEPMDFQMKYQIAPGSPDGTVPPTEVAGDQFRRCISQADEISLGYQQTAPTFIMMMRDWCGFQSLMASPDDPSGLPNHPEWDFRDCTVMGELVAYALRKELESPKGIASLDMCKKLFLASNSISGLHRLVKNSWNLGSRVPMIGGAPPKPELDPEMMKLAREVAKQAAGVIAGLKRQQAATASISHAKAAVAAWSEASDSKLKGKKKGGSGDDADASPAP
mmetsp:Transcript_3708/g.9288  ORF Transcript_3708/g.9288 Transcript_3708/m.9288 type:complete len:615 (-) Transcript_3708:128-1972(-)